MSTTTATDTTPSKAHVIRTLAKSLREYRTASLLSPLFVIVEAVIEIAIPTVIAMRACFRRYSSLLRRS